MRRHLLPLFAAALFVLPAAAQFEAPTDLKDYVDKKDDSFSWKLKDTKESDAGTIYTLDLVSQTWHDIKWDHGMQIVVPKGTKPTATMVLWNQGGSPSANSATLALEIAKRVNAPCAFLYGIPKQPFFDGKKEDALIAETFVRYLESKDPTWPLLFPMVKSLVKAMDAIQAFAKEEWKFDVKSFVVTGASKRGWTSWLTAATGDKRVKAIAPLVIDTLNFQVQMPNQLKSFGKYSEQIKDYEDRKLLPLPDTTEARKLWFMVDPWVYREKLTLPKMIINGTNDPYWAQDALNMYWDDLKGEKYVCYVPNAGHSLRPEEQPNTQGTKTDLFPTRAINCLSAFCRHQVENKPMPKLVWRHNDTPEGVAKLEIKFDVEPKAYRLWIVDSATRDFRKSRWEQGKDDGLKPSPAGIVAYLNKPEAGYRAWLADLDYEIGDLKYTLTTQIRILEPKGK